LDLLKALEIDSQGNEAPAIAIYGEIEPGDTAKLVQAIEDWETYRADRLIVLPALDVASPGGDIIETLKMVEILRKLKIPLVWVRGECYSSCFFLVATAEFKAPTAHAVIGIHRPRIHENHLIGLTAAEAEALHEKVFSVVANLSAELRIPSSLIEKMMATPSSDLYVLPMIDQADLANFSEQGETPTSWWPDLASSPHPGFDEWLEAQCGELASRDTRKLAKRCNEKGTAIPTDMCAMAKRMNDSYISCVREYRARAQVEAINEILGPDSAE
jgi:ATP-dependent protease ClpP protease subunit